MIYLDVWNTKSKSENEINGLVHEKSQMAQMVLQCAQMHTLETSPKFSLLKTLQLFFCFIFPESYFAESLFTSCVIIRVILGHCFASIQDIFILKVLFFLIEPETSIFIEVSSLFTLNQ